MKIDHDRVYLPTSEGYFVSENQRRTAEVLKDFYPYLQLQFIPPADRGPQDYAFRVVDTTPGVPPYVVCFSNDCDERLLARVIQADNKDGSKLDILEAHNRAIELLAKKKRKEERTELHQFMYDVLRMRKFNVRHNGINLGVMNGRS